MNFTKIFQIYFYSVVHNILLLYFNTCGIYSYFLFFVIHIIVYLFLLSLVHDQSG